MISSRTTVSRVSRRTNRTRDKSPALHPLESPSDVLKDLSKKNVQYVQAMKQLEENRELLFTKIGTLEDTISENQELITSFYMQLDNSGLPTVQKEALSVRRNSSFDNKENIETKNIDVIPELQKNPLLIQIFNGEDVDFLAQYNGISPHQRSLFVGYVSRQLSRLATCNKLFSSLTKNVLDFSFRHKIRIAIKTVFCAEKVFVLYKDLKTNLFTEELDGQIIEIDLIHGKSVLASSMLAGTPSIVSDPTVDSSFSITDDRAVNPFDQPMLLLPIPGFALIGIMSTGQEFTFEDVLVGKYFISLASLVMEPHITYTHLVKMAEMRRMIYEFTDDIRTKTNITQLLPFLLKSTTDFVGSNDFELFIIDEKKIFSFFAKDDTLEKKFYDFVGIPAYVVSTKLPIIFDKVSTDSMNYDESIDSWALDQSFIGYPIITSEEEVIGVLCLAGKLTSKTFSQWDKEILNDICAVLSVVIQEQFEAPPISNRFEKAVQNLNDLMSAEFPMKFCLTIENLCECDYVLLAVNDARYCCHEQLPYEKSFILDSYIKLIQAEGPFNKAVIGAPITQIKGFGCIGDVRAENALIYAFKENDLCGVIICLNGKTKFEDSEKFIRPLSTIFLSSLRMHQISNSIENKALELQKLKNVADVCHTASMSENHFISLLTIITELQRMDTFSVWRYSKLGKCFNWIASNKIIESSMPNDDPLMIEVENMEEILIVKGFLGSAYTNSKFLSLTTTCKNLIAVNVIGYLIIINGEQIAENAEQVMEDFKPFIKAFLQEYLDKTGRNTPFVNDLESIDVFNTEIQENDLISRLFTPKQYQPSQRLELVMRVFERTGVREFLGLTALELGKLIVKVKHEYMESLPYHNFDHAVETVQFLYSSLIRGRIRRHFSTEQCAALLLAGLMHDIGHTGTSNEFEIATKSPRAIASKNNPNEVFHARRAIALIRGNFPNTFYDFVAEFILATDFSKIGHISQEMEKIAPVFQAENNEHVLALGRFFISLANVSSACKTFDWAKECAEALYKEWTVQNEKEKTLSLKESTFIHLGSFPDVPSAELALLSTTLRPAFKVLAQVAAELGDFGIQLDDNKRQWEAAKLGL